MMASKAFFDSVRDSLFSGRLSQGQVDGITAIIDACHREELSPEETAYVLATAYHETALTMQPVRESLGRSDAEAYDRVSNWLKRNRRRNYAAIDRDTGQSYYGRGYVQLTHRANYARAGAVLNVDLEHDADQALEPWAAARILVEGMKGGWFTGRKLGNYHLPEQFREARRIVNALDKADVIAGYAEKFRLALSS